MSKPAYCSSIINPLKSITINDIAELFKLKYITLYFPFNYPKESEESDKNIKKQTFAGFLNSLHNYTINTIKLQVRDKNFITFLQPCDKRFMYLNTGMLKKLYSQILLESLTYKKIYYVVGVKYYSAGDVQPCVTGSYTPKDGDINYTVQRELREEIGLDINIDHIKKPNIYNGKILHNNSCYGTMYGYAIHISNTFPFRPSSCNVDYKEGTDKKYRKIMICIYGTFEELFEQCCNIVARKQSADTHEIVGLTFINIMDAISICKDAINKNKHS